MAVSNQHEKPVPHMHDSADQESLNVIRLDRSWRSYLNRGMEALKQSRFANAVEAFEAAYTIAPDQVEVLQALGRERMRQHRYLDALTLLERALAIQPESVATVATLARLLGLHLDQRENAFKIIHRALEQNSVDQNTSPLHIIRGELLLEEGAYLDARAAFGRVLDEDIADEAARIGMMRTYNVEGIALSEQGLYEQAVFAFKRAIDLDARWAGPWVNLGVAFSRIHRPHKALEAFDEALMRDATNPVACFNKGTTLREIGRAKESVEVLEQLFTVAPDYPQLVIALANALCDVGDFDRAIAVLLDEVESAKTSAQSWTALGLAYIGSGNSARGEECLRYAISFDPKYTNAKLNLIIFLVSQGRDEEADQWLEQVREADPASMNKVFGSSTRAAQIRRLERFSFLH